jgi:hypothetical protein
MAGDEAMVAIIVGDHTEGMVEEEATEATDQDEEVTIQEDDTMVDIIEEGDTAEVAGNDGLRKWTSS